jgi:hypothetical protein
MLTTLCRFFALEEGICLFHKMFSSGQGDKLPGAVLGKDESICRVDAHQIISTSLICGAVKQISEPSLFHARPNRIYVKLPQSWRQCTG